MESSINLDVQAEPSRASVSEEVVKDFLVAAALHQLDRVRHFVEGRGLHPDITFGGKPTALCYAVLKPHHGLMDYVLARGADPNHVDQMGMTPLHYAALGGCAVCLATLVGQGADLSRSNRRGETPLALAQSKPGRETAAEFLCRCGASLDPNRTGARRFH